MGMLTLEARLRRRVLWIAVPSLLLVAVATVVIAWWVLAVADRDAAQSHATAALRTSGAELGEGDTPEQAAAETARATEGVGTRVAIRPRGGAWRFGAEPWPGPAAALEQVGCAPFDGAGTGSWIACSASDARAEVAVAVHTESHRHAIGTLAEATGAVVLATWLALAWAVHRSVRGAVRSLGQLVRWSEQVESEPPGSGAAAAPEPDTEEIRRLACAFERLVRRLVEALERERANTAHMAHELRTPLTAMLAEIDRIESIHGQAGLDALRADVTRFARVIEAILVLSSPPSGRTATCIVNVADLAREAADADTRVEAPDEALVEGDSKLIGLALHNLLDNARKHSGQAARAIRVSRVGDAVRVAVVDDGPGLDESARGRMFDRYWRATADGAGSGLGLALVRVVAERHGGNAEATPGREGSGLEVAMTLGPVVDWHDEPSRPRPLDEPAARPRRSDG
jgi:signal transduction histidine kinase